MKLKTQAVIRKRLKDKLAALGRVPKQAGNDEALQQVLLNGIRRRFRRQVAPDGSSWAARADGSKNNLLNKSGKLYKSIGVVASSSYYVNTGAGFRVTADALSDKDNKPYGLFHQRGTPNMPARVFLGVSLQDVRNVTRKFKQLVDRGLRRI